MTVLSVFGTVRSFESIATNPIDCRLLNKSYQDVRLCSAVFYSFVRHKPQTFSAKTHRLTCYLPVRVSFSHCAFTLAIFDTLRRPTGGMFLEMWFIIRLLRQIYGHTKRRAWAEMALISAL